MMKLVAAAAVVLCLFVLCVDGRHERRRAARAKRHLDEENFLEKWDKLQEASSKDHNKDNKAIDDKLIEQILADDSSFSQDVDDEMFEDKLQYPDLTDNSFSDDELYAYDEKKKK